MNLHDPAFQVASSRALAVRRPPMGRSPLQGCCSLRIEMEDDREQKRRTAYAEKRRFGATLHPNGAPANDQVSGCGLSRTALPRYARAMTPTRVADRLADYAFESSCRAHSWSLYGVHVRRRPGSAEGDCLGAAAARDLIEIAVALQEELGSSRVWLWAPEGNAPMDFVRELTQAVLSVRTREQRFGIEMPWSTFERLQAESGTPRLVGLRGLRELGVDVAVRVDGEPAAGVGSAAEAREANPSAMTEGLPEWLLPTSHIQSGLNSINRAGLGAIAGGVRRRTWAMQLADAGAAAVAGPVVGSPDTLPALKRYLGKAEQALMNIRADSI